MKLRIAIVSAILLLTGVAYAIFEAKTTTVTSSWTTVCVAQSSTYTNIQFKLKNTGANPFTDCKVDAWMGPAPTDWVTLSTPWNDCAALAAGDVALWEIAGSAYEQLRVQVKSAAGTTSYCKPFGTR